jgi:hypothetical protein
MDRVVEMTPSQIITQEAQKVGYDADVLLRKINKIVSSKAGILLHKNDSLLLLIAIGEHDAEIHLFSLDSPTKLLSSLKYFVNKIKSSHIEKVYGSKNDAQAGDLEKTLDILDSLGVDVQKSDNPKYHWMATVEGSK